MTHLYVIAVGGRVEPVPGQAKVPTAIGWAAEAVLAVGADEEVRSISRGDSSFVDISGCTVTALPTDIDRAVAAVASRAAGSGLGSTLAQARLLGPDPVLATGSPADLAFWSGDRLVAVVRAGAFTEGDEHFGPFPRAT